MNEHLTDTALAQYLDDALTPPQRDDVRRHAAACETCRRLLSGVEQLVSEVSEWPQSPPGHEPEAGDVPALPLIRGTKVGRYVLLHRLGGGGMGIVYAAYDPALDRQVAVKFIRESVRAPEARLIAEREAKTMARLHHPNVVSVFDVGTLANRTFIAMEFVEGTTLASWLGAAPRSSRDVGAALLAAGRGLEAVHAAGLVHGDFKPANVLIDRAGHVKVTDFGLARDRASHDAHLRGAGTVAFMAPEQLGGGHADAQSDQFAFCTTLRTALAKTPNDLLQRRLLGVAKRGCEHDPARRYAGMSVVVGELQRALSGARRWVTGLAVVGLAALGVAAGWAASHRAPCGEGGGLVAEVWPEDRRAAVAAAFGRSAAPYASAVGDTVLRELDGYAKRWVSQRTKACEATHVRHEQSEALLDLRVDCFERRRVEFSTVVKELESAEGPTVSRAVDLVLSLEPLDRCDARALLDHAPAPVSGVERAAVEAAWQQIAAAKTARAAGRFKEVSVAEQALARAEQAQSPYLEAEALVLLADFQDGAKATQTAWRALAAAEAGHHDVAKAQALFKILEGEVNQSQTQQRTNELVAFARAAVARAGDPPLLTMLLNRSVGSTLRKTGRVVEAIDVLKASVAFAERTEGLPPHLVANGYNTLGVALMTGGRYDEALPALLTARERLTRLVGPDHPLVAQTEVNLGATDTTLGRLEEADAMLGHAAGVYERSLGRPNTFTPGVLINRAEVDLLRGRLDHALELSRRALELYVEASGPTSANAALAHTQTGQVLYRLGRYGEALTELNEARRLYVQLRGPDAPELTEVLSLLGMTQASLHDNPSALLTLTEAVRVGVLARGADNCESAQPRYPLAKVLLALGQEGAATSHLETALRVCEHRQEGAQVTQLVRFELAKARWRHGHRPTSLNDAQLALEAYAALPGAEAQELAEMRAWLDHETSGAAHAR